MKILIVDDDRELCKIIKKELLGRNHTVDCCYSGELALYYAQNTSYHLILLDRMLPVEDGLSILQKIRASEIYTPVILITALGQLHDKIEGLDLGADDYISKPFEMEELLARIRAIARRPYQIEESLKELSYGDLILERKSLSLKCHNNSVQLTRKEYCLFEYLLQNPSKILSRDLILSAVWSMDSEVEPCNVDNYIYFFRKRLKYLKSKVTIKTIYGTGYQLSDGESKHD